ncbi:uncharacterized protein LOC106871955 [Octopus bimaculoides]|uniref:Uncharacterized protein n=1 Tax=Octopus bimaculoides TaxID=37653 RepID=A0A0L8HB66_OCTBM|nr:uncharacterized protein LOC106871955 [Octopus bimaculoides]|eukprot:XP_014774223.1 PREDICTED: suppressor protein SRP40-like [Octopus bimaculoides]
MSRAESENTSLAPDMSSVGSKNTYKGKAFHTYSETESVSRCSFKDVTNSERGNTSKVDSMKSVFSLSDELRANRQELIFHDFNRQLRKVKDSLERLATRLSEKENFSSPSSASESSDSDSDIECSNNKTQKNGPNSKRKSVDCSNILNLSSSDSEEDRNVKYRKQKRTRKSITVTTPSGSECSILHSDHSILTSSGKKTKAKTKKRKTTVVKASSSTDFSVSDLNFITRSEDVIQDKKKKYRSSRNKNNQYMSSESEHISEAKIRSRQKKSSAKKSSSGTGSDVSIKSVSIPMKDLTKRLLDKFIDLRNKNCPPRNSKDASDSSFSSDSLHETIFIRKSCEYK